MIIETNIEQLRDPFILVADGVYYAYGTEWKCYKNTSGRLSGEWVELSGEIVKEPLHFVKNKWAPEVHKYNGAYYMLTTYFSSLTNHRGCSVFKSDSPEGPFVEIGGGHFTPSDWDAIDATLYVDEEGQPWTVFVHEWTSTDDGIGRMAAAKLSPDLTHLISEPVELFRADSPPWTKREVTDGCFIYKTKEGKLLMIWSNFLADKSYSIGVAESDGGILGNWTHKERLLYSKDMLGTYDGGHGMIFSDKDGRTYLSMHSPNVPTHGRKEKPVIIEIFEKDGELVLDFN
ncbi:MAG: family 43 glycosylhydrolase [Clostridia bacterium]|nr:family 43 glycosylhydrolase [Clostridia bacterium]